MKKIITILILLLSINVFAEENVFNIGTQSINAGTGPQTLRVDGKSGYVSVDLDTKTIEFNNFNYDIDSLDDLFLTSSYTSYTPYTYNYSFIYSNINDDFNINFTGNNIITIKNMYLENSLYNIQFFSFLNNENIKGTDENSKLNINFEKQIGDTIQLFNFIKNPYNKTLNMEDLELNINSVDHAYQMFGVISSTTTTITNSIINLDLGEGWLEGDPALETVDFYITNGSTLNISDSTINAKVKKDRCRAYFFSGSNVNVENTDFDVQIDYNGGVSALIGYDGNADTTFTFKDGSIKVRGSEYGIFTYSDYKTTMEFDNTYLDIESSSGALYAGYTFDHVEYPATVNLTFKNYERTPIVYIGKSDTVGKFYNSSLVIRKYAIIKTLPKGNLYTERTGLEEEIDLTEQDQNYLDLGLDITLSITQEVITNPTESIVSLVNTKKGDNKVLDYIDINFIKEVNKTKTYIHESKNEIEISIPLENKYITNKAKREYKILRVHEGEVEELESEIIDNKIVFKTNKFSTYVLTYHDTITNPQTGDNLTNNIILAIISVIVLAIVLIVYKKKK